jgi:zinc transport system ATP-binding protein
MHELNLPVVALEGVSFGYRAGVRVLEDVSLAVAPGEFVAIAGPNGGGKTTLLRIVLGLERPSEGSVRVFGHAAGKGREGGRIGYLPQRSRLLGEAPVTVREIVSTGRLAPAGIWGPLRRADRDAVARAIETVGLADRADAPLRTLSGGMQQRALIAKALASEPTLLALDEPTTGVDAASQESLGLLLETLRADLGVTILYVSHEFGAGEHVVDRIVLVRGGIVYDGPPSGLPGVWHDPSHHHDHGHRHA